MKLLLLLFVMLSYNSGYSQELPDIEVDSSRRGSSYSAEIDEFLEGYDEYIFYQKRSSWTKTHVKYMIGRKGDTWESYTFAVRYKGDRYINQSKYRIKKRKNELTDVHLERVLNWLDSTQFYTVDPDSLNAHEIKINDSTTQLLIVTDGSSDIFTIGTAKGTYTISAYMVDHYQAKLFIEDRKTYIEGRAQFLSLF